jgi:hypothetical protein
VLVKITELEILTDLHVFSNSENEEGDYGMSYVRECPSLAPELLEEFCSNRVLWVTGLLFFFYFSIVRYSRDLKTLRFGNWICFRHQVKVMIRHLLSWDPFTCGRKQIQFPKRCVF